MAGFEKAPGAAHPIDEGASEKMPSPCASAAWRPDRASFFSNVECPYFPCHEGIEPERFNCLFCYCPLFALGPACGGEFRYTENGCKDCSACARIHDGDGAARLVEEKFALLAELARRGPQDA